jgi:CheY-like chemotaxis protein
MAKQSNRTSPRAWRPARTPVQDVRATLGGLDCQVANLSTTGAMLRTRVEVAVGHETEMLLHAGSASAAAQVRVVRCEPVETAMPGAAVWRRQDFALGVMFLNGSRDFAALIRTATRGVAGIEHTEPRVLVIGQDDEVSKLVSRALTEGEYHPRVLTHARYAISTAKRIGAKAIIVNLEIDPDFSARSVFDTLCAEPATAKLPIIMCARNAWLGATHRHYIEHKRLRLLLVPFTPEELILTLDRALDETK